LYDSAGEVGTMATTPPPKPIEELASETDEKEPEKT